MTRCTVALALSFALLGGCKVHLLPDPLEAHPLAQETTIKVLVRRADGTFQAERVKYPAGSLIATPEAIRAAEREP